MDADPADVLHDDELPRYLIKVRLVLWTMSGMVPDSTYIDAAVGDTLVLSEVAWLARRVPVSTAWVDFWSVEEGDWRLERLANLSLEVSNTSPAFLMRLQGTKHCPTLGNELKLVELAAFNTDHDDLPKIEKMVLPKVARAHILTITAWNEVNVGPRAHVRLADHTEVIKHLREDPQGGEPKAITHVERWDNELCKWKLQDINRVFVFDGKSRLLLVRHDQNRLPIGLAKEIARAEQIVAARRLGAESCQGSVQDDVEVIDLAASDDTAVAADELQSVPLSLTGTSGTLGSTRCQAQTDLNERARRKGVGEHLNGTLEVGWHSSNGLAKEAWLGNGGASKTSEEFFAPSRLTYKADYAGAWAMICLGCKRAHFPTQWGPSEEQLEEIEQQRQEDEEEALTKRVNARKARLERARKSRSVGKAKETQARTTKNTKKTKKPTKPFGIVSNVLDSKKPEVRRGRDITICLWYEFMTNARARRTSYLSRRRSICPNILTYASTTTLGSRRPA
ncbi:hypothetical protein C8Q73DRAFT_669447 [Cubamyces lactineus]|nr:hypothetical protein C8Q73DRAFT_669447 [Cubamyces lactineus]